MRPLKLLVTIGMLVLAPWFFYANQTQQKATCVLYQLAGVKPGLVQQVTCTLNGHAQ
ncbi:MAG TPA: hypothetical protein VH914_19405 [Acidimicrobiia bacterium]|jgi:hypothetical protein|nr:hypothetical protein [Acidimicrobiia bacterium]